MLPLIILSLFSCGSDEAVQGDTCSDVPGAFQVYVDRVLTDSTGLFKHDYPPVTPLTCELLGMLQEDLKDDSARYYFERFAQKYWHDDPHAHGTHAYIRRHLSFSLAIAATAHWFADTRIEGLRELQEYRRMRPMVCTTKDGYSKLERQDRAAVRYLIRVLETTPLFQIGSENSTIHGIYIQEVMAALDLFTGQYHQTAPELQLRLNRSEADVQKAIVDWRKWLEE